MTRMCRLLVLALPLSVLAKGQRANVIIQDDSGNLIQIFGR